MNHFRFCFALSSVVILGGVANATLGNATAGYSSDSFSQSIAGAPATKQTAAAFVCVKIVTSHKIASLPSSDLSTPYSDCDQHPNFWLVDENRAMFASAATPDDFIASNEPPNLDHDLLQSLLNELHISDQLRNETLNTQLAMLNQFSASPEAVPEPSTLAVFGAAALALVARRRRSVAAI